MWQNLIMFRKHHHKPVLHITLSQELNALSSTIPTLSPVVARVTLVAHRFLGGSGHNSIQYQLFFTFGHDVSSCYNDLNQSLGRVRHAMRLHYFPKDELS